MTKKSTHGGHRGGAGRKTNQSKGLDKARKKQLFYYPSDIAIARRYEPHINALIRGFIRSLDSLSDEEKQRLITLGKDHPK